MENIFIEIVGPEQCDLTMQYSYDDILYGEKLDQQSMPLASLDSKYLYSILFLLRTNLV